MFFMAGVSSKQKKLDFDQTIICPQCGKYGHYEVFMEYTYLSLFFIPTLKWNIRYYVKNSCCSSIYSISKELGDRINNGENIMLTELDLQLIQGGQIYSKKQCPNCGFETDENYQYCPKCASQLK